MNTTRSLHGDLYGAYKENYTEHTWRIPGACLKSTWSIHGACMELSMEVCMELQRFCMWPSHATTILDILKIILNCRVCIRNDLLT